MIDLFGFIILRHVNSEKTNKYWNHSVKLIRTFYPNIKIVIIDDNSNYDYVNSEFNYPNIQIIQSEFPRRGELLPYYYYLKYGFFQNAIIIHDSVFIHKHIRFEKLVGLNVLPLWYFQPDKENINNTNRITSCLNNKESLHYHLNNISDNIFKFKNGEKQHNKWNGCFGVQSFINLKFLKYIEIKYKITNLIKEIHCRRDRCCLERILGCIFFIENPNIQNIKSLFGNIHYYQKWGYSYNEYMKHFNEKKIVKNVVKVWTGR